jgi:hypothetical protein
MQDDIEGLLLLSHKYDIKRPLAACTTFLSAAFTIEGFYQQPRAALVRTLQWLGTAQRLGLDELHEDIMSCIEHNLQQLPASDDELDTAVNEDWHLEPASIRRAAVRSVFEAVWGIDAEPGINARLAAATAADERDEMQANPEDADAIIVSESEAEDAEDLEDIEAEHPLRRLLTSPLMPGTMRSSGRQRQTLTRILAWRRWSRRYCSSSVTRMIMWVVLCHGLLLAWLCLLEVMM